MGSVLGGGGSQKTTTQVKLPAWIEQAGKDYFTQASSVSKNLASPYQGQTVAALTPDQISSMQQIKQLSNFSLNPETIQAQMNPYISNVEQQALQQGQKAFLGNLNQLSDAAVRSGGGFGSRLGVQEGVAASENAQNQAMLSAQLRQQGYQQAVQNALAGQAASMQSALQGFQTAGFGQAQNQAELAAAQNQYNAMRGYPIEQLNILGTALGQVPYGQTTTSSTPMSGNPLLGAMGGAMGFGQTFSSPYAPWLGGGLGFLAGLSDPSMKTDVQKLGKDKETGLNMYAYRYKGDPKSYPKVVGPMADEIQKKYPDQVKKVGGKLAVNANFLMGKVK